MIDSISKVMVKAMKNKWFEYNGVKIPPFKYRIINARKREERYYEIEVEFKFHKMNIFEKLFFFYKKKKSDIEFDAMMLIMSEFKKIKDIKVFGLDSVLVKKVTVKFF